MQEFSQIAGQQPPLITGGLQIWRFSVRDFRPEFADCLDDAERGRAGRMRAGVAREEFLLGRSALRRLLGGVIGCAPAAISISTGAHGKPFLADQRVEFNVAHSHGLILIALSRAGAVGIDVEFRNSAVEAEEIAADSFHLEEIAEIMKASPGEERLTVFYRCWARKEAALKADGRGLIDSLSVFSVAPCAVQIEDLPATLPDGAPLWVRDLNAGRGFAGALACETRGVRVDFIEGREWLSG